jgi:hypothetical protein
MVGWFLRGRAAPVCAGAALACAGCAGVARGPRAAIAPATQTFKLAWDWPWAEANRDDPVAQRAQWVIEWSSNAVNWVEVARGPSSTNATVVRVPWTRRGFFRIGAFCPW